MPTVKTMEARKSPFIQRKRVAAYARVSVERELTQHSLEAQISQYSRQIASRRDWEYAGVFSDYGVTGTKIDRPGFKALLEACELGKIDIILTKSISRFARNTVDLLKVTRHLKELGISVRFERENIDTLTSQGEVLLTLLASFAEEEARSVSENTKWALRKGFEKGNGVPHRLYGYRWNGKDFILLEDEAEMVRLVFSWYIDGLSPNDIVDRLDAQGYESLSGEPFNYSTVWGMLRQEKYTGMAILQKTFYPDCLTKRRRVNNGELPRFRVENAYPQIISQEEFDAAQAEIARRSTMGFMLTREITITCFCRKVKCSICGASYRRQYRCHVSKDGTPQKRYYYWACSTRLSKGGIKACASERIPETALYDLTARALGKESFTESDFNSQIDHITVQKGRILIFHKINGENAATGWGGYEE